MSISIEQMLKEKKVELVETMSDPVIISRELLPRRYEQLVPFGAAAYASRSNGVVERITSRDASLQEKAEEIRAGYLKDAVSDNIGSAMAIALAVLAPYVVYTMGH